MTEQTQDDGRRTFQAWALNNNLSIHEYDHGANAYSHDNTAMAWAGFQAAWRPKEQQAEPVAWHVRWKRHDGTWGQWRESDVDQGNDVEVQTRPLYLAPPAPAAAAVPDGWAYAESASLYEIMDAVRRHGSTRTNEGILADLDWMPAAAPSPQESKPRDVCICQCCGQRLPGGYAENAL